MASNFNFTFAINGALNPNFFSGTSGAGAILTRLKAESKATVTEKARRAEGLKAHYYAGRGIEEYVSEMKGSFGENSCENLFYRKQEKVFCMKN